MQREWRYFPLISQDWQSKLVDGVLASLILFLTWLVVALAVQMVNAKYGNPGLLVLVFGLMAIALFSLQQALMSQHSEPSRAWYGTAGGFLAWSVVSVSSYFGLPASKAAGLIIIIMLSLIVAVLWRVLPVGPRFFSLAFLLNWLSSLITHAEEVLANFSPVFALLYRATGYLAILFAVLVMGWILFVTHRRTQRIGGALLIWFLVSLALYVFRGYLF